MVIDYSGDVPATPRFSARKPGDDEETGPMGFPPPGDPIWRAQPAWFIDAINGKDSNYGNDAAHPIKTHAEWANRVQPATWDLTNSVLVTYINCPGQADPLPLQRAPNVRAGLGLATAIWLKFQGPPPTVKAGHGGAVTAVTPRVRATNTPGNITTTGILNASDLGLRMQIVGGARNGAVSYPVKVLGANQVRASEWEITAVDEVTFVDTHVTPVIGDVVQVMTQGVIFANLVAIQGGNEQGALFFNDLDISSVSSPNVPGTQGDSIQLTGVGAWQGFQRCRFPDAAPLLVAVRNTESQNPPGFWGFTIFVNCMFGGGVQFLEGDCFGNSVNGGACVFSPGALSIFALTLIGAGAQLDADFLIQGGSMGPAPTGQLLVGAAAAFDAPGILSGVIIGSQGIVHCGVLFYGVRAIWGAGNAVAGVDIADFGVMRYETLASITIAGPAGKDYRLSGQFLAWSFVGATPAYQPAGGLATTYPLLAAAVGGPGLGGQAVFPGGNSAFILAGGPTNP